MKQIIYIYSYSKTLLSKAINYIGQAGRKYRENTRLKQKTSNSLIYNIRQTYGLNESAYAFTTFCKSENHRIYYFL